MTEYRDLSEVERSAKAVVDSINEPCTAILAAAKKLGEALDKPRPQSEPVAPSPEPSEPGDEWYEWYEKPPKTPPNIQWLCKHSAGNYEGFSADGTKMDYQWTIDFSSSEIWKCLPGKPIEVEAAEQESVGWRYQICDSDTYVFRYGGPNNRREYRDAYDPWQDLGPSAQSSEEPAFGRYYRKLSALDALRLIEQWDAENRAAKPLCDCQCGPSEVKVEIGAPDGQVQCRGGLAMDQSKYMADHIADGVMSGMDFAATEAAKIIAERDATITELREEWKASDLRAEDYRSETERLMHVEAELREKLAATEQTFNSVTATCNRVIDEKLKVESELAALEARNAELATKADEECDCCPAYEKFIAELCKCLGVGPHGDGIPGDMYLAMKAVKELKSRPLGKLSEEQISRIVNDWVSDWGMLNAKAYLRSIAVPAAMSDEDLLKIEAMDAIKKHRFDLVWDENKGENNWVVVDGDTGSFIAEAQTPWSAVLAAANPKPQEPTPVSYGRASAIVASSLFKSGEQEELQRYIDHTHQLIAESKDNH